MTNTTKITLFATLMAAGVAALALGPMGGRMAKELGLSPEQTQKIESLRYDHQKEMIGLKGQMQVKRLDLRKEMEKDTPDPAALDKLVDEGAALRATMQKARLHHLLDMKKILTPEQWQKAKAHFAEHMGEMGGARGRGHGGPGGNRGEGAEGCPGAGKGPGHGPHGPAMGQGGGPGPAPQGTPLDDDEDDF